MLYTNVAIHKLTAIVRKDNKDLNKDPKEQNIAHGKLQKP